MALLIPICLILAGAVVLLLLRWRDPEFRGAGLAFLLYVVLFAGTIGFVALGAWGWVRTRQWDSITIGEILGALARLGVKVDWANEPKWYLESDVAWTVFLVPLVLLGVWRALAKPAPAARKKVI